VSVHFDACAAINNNPSLVIRCGGLLWEQEYRLNDKYTCDQASPNPGVMVTTGLTVPPGAVCHGPPGRGRKRQHSSKKGVTTSSCKLGACNPINFTILYPEEWRWKIGHKVGIYKTRRGTDAGPILHFKRVMVPLKASSHQVFHSFYEEIESSPLPISTMTRICFWPWQRL
jgi:hypothetical protein